MTVFIYVNTGKHVGDPDHLKVFANADAAETWFEENDSRPLKIGSMLAISTGMSRGKKRLRSRRQAWRSISSAQVHRSFGYLPRSMRPTRRQREPGDHGPQALAASRSVKSARWRNLWHRSGNFGDTDLIVRFTSSSKPTLVNPHVSSSVAESKDPR
jgi:hypothetical protein